MGIEAVRTRFTASFAFILALVLIGLPAGLFGWNDVGLNGNASASGAGNRTITVGVLDFQSSIKTLNPLLYSMGNEYDVIWPCYSTLMQYDAGRNMTGDLATSWDVSSDGLTYHFKITPYAQFYNRLSPTVVHPLTVNDIIFTYYLVQNTSNSLQSYLPKIDNQYVINSMWAVNDYEFYIKTNVPYAPLWGALATIPILPQYIWQNYSVNWANYDMTSGIPPCVGSGAWYYALDGLPYAGSVELDRSPTWFATEERGWQMHPSKLIFRSEVSTSALLSDLQTGVIDIYEHPTQAQYLNSLPGSPGVSEWSFVTGFVYDCNMNQMTGAERASLGGAYSSGSNNQLLLEPVVKQAMMMCVDKQGFVNNVTGSALGSPADSFVPPTNFYHYDYGNRTGETPITFNPSGARALLNANGWCYDQAGSYNPNATPLCQVGGTNKLQFRFWTLNIAPDWNTGAQLIADWTWSAGIDLKTLYSQVSTTFIAAAFAAGDYDVWLSNQVFTPTSDPSTDIMQAFTSMAIGSANQILWSNSTFDSLYNQSLFQTDFATRYDTVADMQAMAYSSGSWPVAYRADLYAATTGGPDHWTNWGNWSQQYLLEPDQGMPYLYMRISPDATQGQNPAPVITTMEKTYSAFVNASLTFSASATDNDALVYRWFWGDGSRTDWLTSPTTTHAYTRGGVYTAWLAVREDGTADNFTTVASCSVTILQGNQPPTNVDFSYYPSDPDTGTTVLFNGTASDPDGDLLTYSWTFGDGNTTSGQNVTHQFMTGPGTYNVTLSVDDGYPGNLPVAVWHQVNVTNNTPPTCIVPAYPNVMWKQPTNFTIASYDPDTRDSHRYTWVWGDGSTTVTTTTTATHTYNWKQTFTLTVYADDLTGLPGHNVSGSNFVLVGTWQLAPVISGFAVSNSTPQIGQWLTFTGGATDIDSDFLWYMFDFGDGNQTYASGYSDPVTPLNLSVQYYYTSPGTYTAYLYVTDNYSTPVVSSPIAMTVVIGNVAPEVAPLHMLRVTTVYNGTYTAAATDADNDSLRYTWDFGDGTPLLVGNDVQHMYLVAGNYTLTVYVDDLTGFVGHNVSSQTLASITTDFTLNLVPGWNLVTVPPVGFGYRASTLGLAAGDIVVGFNPSGQNYALTYVVGVSPAPLDFAIAPSTGYWIHTSGTESLHLYGYYPSTTMTRNLTFSTGAGWALVAFNTLNTTWKASMVPAMFGGNISTVVCWLPLPIGIYDTYIYGVPVTDFVLVPGLAYWVYCTTIGTLSYNP